MCTLWVDGLNGVVRHIEQNADFVVAAAADPATLRAHAARPGLGQRPAPQLRRQHLPVRPRGRGRGGRPGLDRLGLHRSMPTVRPGTSTAAIRAWPRTSPSGASTCSRRSGTSSTSRPTAGATGTPGWTTDVPFVRPSDMLAGEPLPGWNGRFLHSAHMTFAHYDIAAGAAPLHEHAARAGGGVAHRRGRGGPHHRRRGAGARRRLRRRGAARHAALGPPALRLPGHHRRLPVADRSCPACRTRRAAGRGPRRGTRRPDCRPCAVDRTGVVTPPRSWSSLAVLAVTVVRPGTGVGPDEPAAADAALAASSTGASATGRAVGARSRPRAAPTSTTARAASSSSTASTPSTSTRPYELYPGPGKPWNFSAADASLMARLGFNVVRLGMTWSGLEPGTAPANDPAICGPGRPTDPHQFNRPSSTGTCSGCARP